MVKVTRLPTGIRWQGQRPGFPEQVPLKFTGKLLQWGFFLFFFFQECYHFFLEGSYKLHSKKKRVFVTDWLGQFFVLQVYTTTR